MALALHESLAALETRDKALLRLHVVEQLNIDVVGAAHGVHRATAARWLVAIRGRVLTERRRRAALHWGVSSHELGELWEILRDEIDLSVLQALGDPDACAASTIIS